MKVAIVGSRSFKNAEEVYRKICENIPRNCSEVVSGGAAGIDTLAERYAKENSLTLTVFLPKYDKYGKSATVLRNSEIVEYADIIYAFWDMQSKGTQITLKKCIECGKPCKIIRI